MNAEELIIARRKAEGAVADMVEGPLKIKAFEVILGSLLNGATAQPIPTPTAKRPENTGKKSATSVASRIALLAEEGFFLEPRSLSEIQGKLAEHGWHYPQPNLSTPLVRLVRQRELRRLPTTDGGKKVWKYSLI
jgi:hypothetical protein